jgi:hypothetical protein
MIDNKDAIQFLLSKDLHFFPIPDNGIGISSTEDRFKDYELKLRMSPDQSKLMIEIYKNKNKIEVLQLRKMILVDKLIKRFQTISRNADEKRTVQDFEQAVNYEKEVII